MRISRIAPPAILLGLSGWAISNLIRKALRERNEPTRPMRSDFEPMPVPEPADPVEHDVGDLYGVHTPRAGSTDLRDDDQTFERGENWLEALEVSAVEYGTEDPEVELEIVDDDDLREGHS